MNDAPALSGLERGVRRKQVASDAGSTVGKAGQRRDQPQGAQVRERRQRHRRARQRRRRHQEARPAAPPCLLVMLACAQPQPAAHRLPKREDTLRHESARPAKRWKPHRHQTRMWSGASPQCKLHAIPNTLCGRHTARGKKVLQCAGAHRGVRRAASARSGRCPAASRPAALATLNSATSAACPSGAPPSACTSWPARAAECQGRVCAAQVRAQFAPSRAADACRFAALCTLSCREGRMHIIFCTGHKQSVLARA